MPLNKILQSLKGQCRYCGQQTGLIQRDYPQCWQTYQAGFQEMIQLAAHAATNHTFSEDTFRQSLRAIAQRSRATDKDIDAPSRMAGNRASPARCPTASSADRMGVAVMVRDKYAVRLTPEERENLQRLVRGGKSSARMTTRARILL